MELHRNVEDWERIASIALGLTIVGYAASRRRPVGIASLVGVGLIGRGIAGFCPMNAVAGRGRMRDDTREALGGSRGIRLHESVTIRRPAAELYAFWAQPENLARMLRHVDSVESLPERRSHWKMRSLGGVTMEWDAETINDVPNELIAWRSLPGADVASAGSVTFRAHGDDATEVTVLLQYDPPGGKAAAMFAALFGQSPASLLREDLRGLKRLLETGGSPTVQGQSHGKRGRLNLAKWVDA